MNDRLDHAGAEARFRLVFAQLGAVTAYARRRGSRDADGIAAEVMAIAWRRLADVPTDDPRPWLFATARNLVFAEARRAARVVGADPGSVAAQAPDLFELDPELASALRSLSPLDREALLLIAWEDLTPSQAARTLRINPAAFRVRLLRARRRLRAALEAGSKGAQHDPATRLNMERT
ncbi:MAG TPA: sigma-70 family RNA polymerase sigma factor [Gaiellaceae bacterium]